MSPCEKQSAFKEKLLQWIRRVKKANVVNFSSLEETLGKNASLPPDLVSDIAERLQLFCTEYDGHFLCGELQTYDYWIRHSFKLTLKDIDDDSDILKNFID